MSQHVASGTEKSFGPIRSCLWPIYANEVRKLVPMILMVFLICFNYSILRNMKDTVVVTASGAEVIPFIKVWVMFPMAVILTIVFTKLSNRFSQEKVFYIMMGGFLIFFDLFAFVLYPLRDILHPHATADHLETLLPMGFKGLISMFRHWTFTGFYVMSELWASICLHVLFWGFANEITRIGEANRFYSVLGIGANVAAICAGQSAIFLSDLPFSTEWLFGVREKWEQSQLILISVVTLSGLATMAIFRWMNHNVLKDPSFEQFHQNKRDTKAKGKQSFRESFRYLSTSKYLICIAVLVVAYNLVINLVEVVWKDQLRQLYPDPHDFNTYMNNLTTLMGIASTITAIFMAKIIGRFGWTKTALITPIIMLITCAGFFAFYFLREHLAGLVIATLGTTPLAIAVFFGGAQNCLSKAAKYSVFDVTKEMAYIPLDHDVKLKGKAAIDGVGSRFGKSGGSVFYQGLLIMFSTISACAPYVAALLFLVIFFWISAAKSLGKQFGELVASQEKPPVKSPSPGVQEQVPQAV